MQKIRCVERVNYNIFQMFDLVNDIENYPKFISMCTDTNVYEKTPFEVKAILKVQKGPLKMDFGTYNTMMRPHLIKMDLLTGPFKNLQGFWRFFDLNNDSCEINFDLEFEFKNKILELTFGSIVKNLSKNMLTAFCFRADSLFNKENK